MMPRIDNVETNANKAASRAALIRRRQAMLSRSDAMSSSPMGGAGKTKLGQ